MQRIPESAATYSIRSQADLYITIPKILNMSMLADCSEVDRSLICTIASELATNIIKYAGSGKIQIRRFDLPEFTDIEVTATDKGPGIGDVQSAMVESYSSGGTLGLGLSGVKRISNKFEINSGVDCGTTVVATKRIRNTLSSVNYERFQSRYSLPATNKIDRVTQYHHTDKKFFPVGGNECLDIGIRIRCSYGQRLSGDQVCVATLPYGYLIGIIDVTGHGPDANTLSNRLANLINDHATSDLLSLMNLLHTEATGTIGASVGLAYINTQTAQIDYLGLGNTTLLLLSNENWRPVSRSGVLGTRLPTLSVQTKPFLRHDLLLMFTDGVSESTLTKDLQGLLYKSSESIANSLVEIAGKKYDDASCAVAKWIR